jgi:hypothetical protein
MGIGMSKKRQKTLFEPTNEPPPPRDDDPETHWFTLEDDEDKEP